MDAASLLAPLAAAPGRTALVLDVDGTLAPIVARPALATVPPETRTELRRLASRYLLVACVSGRPGAEAERLVGVEGLRYVGNHGLELDPRAGALAVQLARFREVVNGAWPVEDKLLSLAFHFRGAPNEAAAVATLEAVAERARAAGLTARFGRRVLEVRPPSEWDKGRAVRSLIEECGASLALYAGDDTTDLDAFRALGASGLERALRVAVASAEAPPGLIAAGDLVVSGPGELLELLRRL
ncbi:MAG: trehalose-phosphatase [Thermoleophilia bacterium]|nr:trehalose-phosphatase [Thermoleophilia bacterium]